MDSMSIADLNNLRRDLLRRIAKSICKESRRKRPKKEDKKVS